MMKLKEIDLLKLQTAYMRNDETTVAMCKAINTELNKIDPQRCLIMFNLNSLPENILDEIAFSENIFWYDYEASIDVKRGVIRNADKVFRHLGTDYAVEKVITDYFGDGVVASWYDYGGEPGHFKVYTSNLEVNTGLINQFINAISLVKRKSAILDEVIVNMVENYNIYCGFALHAADKLTLRQEVL